MNKPHVWECKIGAVGVSLPPEADLPMREAISEAFLRLTGRTPEFCFSGWGSTLTRGEEEVAYPPKVV